MRRESRAVRCGTGDADSARSAARSPGGMHDRLNSSTSSELRAALPPPALASRGPPQPNTAPPPSPSRPVSQRAPQPLTAPGPPLPALRSLRPRRAAPPACSRRRGGRERKRGGEGSGATNGHGAAGRERPPVPAAGQAVPRAPRLPLAASFRGGIGGKNSNRRRGRRATGARPGPRRDRRAPAARQRAARREHCFCGSVSAALLLPRATAQKTRIRRGAGTSAGGCGVHRS